jgi:hypothetical protein
VGAALDVGLVHAFLAALEHVVAGGAEALPQRLFALAFERQRARMLLPALLQGAHGVERVAVVRVDRRDLLDEFLALRHLALALLFQRPCRVFRASVNRVSRRFFSLRSIAPRWLQARRRRCTVPATCFHSASPDCRRAISALASSTRAWPRAALAWRSSARWRKWAAAGA